LDADINVPEVAIQNFQAILAHELAHTDFLDAALAAVGAEPVQGCSFNFDTVLTDVATMAAVARVVEAVGVGAYLGGAVLVDDKNILVSAASILTIEARHQTFLNTINAASAVPQAFDIALTPPQVLAIAGGFISGCDLGIPANPTLTITNQGPVAAGTLLEFSSDAIDAAGDAALSCQMIVGDRPEAISLALADCIVPDGVNGPVAIFITNDEQPLAANVVIQNAAQIVAGPTIAFIDSVGDALGALVRSGGAPIESTQSISPDEAQDRLNEGSSTGAPAETGSDGPAPDATSSSAGATPTDGAGTAKAPIKVIGHSKIPA
jgi:hypothetical protein